MSTVAYLRTSTRHQTVAMQRTAIEAAGVSIDRVFSDEGVSGRRSSRPGLDAMLSWVRDGDVVVVYSLSRLGRSTADLLARLRDLGERGVAVRSITETIDTATPGGRLVVTILAAVAEMEADLTRERVMAGLDHARSQGRVGGRPPTDPDKVTAVRRLVAACTSPTVAAREVGVSRATAYRVTRDLRQSGESDES